MNKLQIAVLMTCHNRRDTTLGCLRALINQESIDDVNLEVYLVDAGSTDGTVTTVREGFPQVNLIVRDEGLYWCGGMRAAFAEAMKNGYDCDYYLWLNSDTMLYREAVRHLVDTAAEIESKYSKDSIIVGSLHDPDTGKHTYGGVAKVSKVRPIFFEPLVPSDVAQQCDTMNGNCVLVPRSIAALLGNLSKEFTHRMADTDYGLRAKARGIPIWVAPKYVGVCPRNPVPPWRDPQVSLWRRLKFLYSPKGLPPAEWIVFTKRHAGIMWPVYWLKLHFRVLFPEFLNWFSK